MSYKKWHKIDQKTKCLILGSLDYVLQQLHISIVMVYDILLRLLRLFGDKGTTAK